MYFARRLCGLVSLLVEYLPHSCSYTVSVEPLSWVGNAWLLSLDAETDSQTLGILLVSIISWPRTTPVTLFPHTAVGDSNFDFFKKVVAFHKLEKIGNALDVGLSNSALVNRV
jgi:AGZA family xanthine/uracil permease-like MFS transporter